MLLNSSVNSQFDISIGASYLNEGLVKIQYQEKHPFRVFLPNINFGYRYGLNQTSLTVGCFSKSNIFGQYTYNSSWGGGSSPTSFNNHNYSSKINFTSLSVAISQSRIFEGFSLIDKSKIAQLRIGLFVNIETPIFQEEFDQNHVHVYGNNSNSTHTMTSTTVIGPNEFKLLEVNKFHASLGLTLLRRVYIKSFFFEFGGNFGLLLNSRYKLRMHASQGQQDSNGLSTSHTPFGSFMFKHQPYGNRDKQRYYLFYGASLSIGYTFKKI